MATPLRSPAVDELPTQRPTLSRAPARAARAPLTASDMLGWSRFPLAALLVVIEALSPGSHWPLAIVIGIAGFTDVFDGLLARHGGTADRSGGILDYMADKFFFTIGVLVLTARGDIGLVIAAIVMGRDVIVSGMRLAMFTAGADLPARRLGKVRTLFMYPTLGLVALDAPGVGALLFAIAAISLLSLVDYGGVFLRHVRSLPQS